MAVHVAQITINLDQRNLQHSTAQSNQDDYTTYDLYVSVLSPQRLSDTYQFSSPEESLGKMATQEPANLNAFDFGCRKAMKTKQIYLAGVLIFTFFEKLSLKQVSISE